MTRFDGVLWLGIALIVAGPATAADKEVERLKDRVSELERQLGVDEPPPVSTSHEDEGDEEPRVMAGDDDPTGTDPRSFGSKFMPYYRWEKLRNDLEVNSLVAFGMIRFSDTVAMTYEAPIAKRVDYNSVRGFRNFKRGIGNAFAKLEPGSGCGGSGGAPCSSILFNDLDLDGDEVGVGDLNLRMFGKGFATTDSPMREGGEFEFMTGLEVTMPTATEDVLGSGSLVLSPMAIFVMDMPLMGFIAAMNFYDFDAWRDKDRGHTSRFRGRWFYMQPLTPPDWEYIGGLYLLPELQPVYDFSEDHFSFWIGPEFGKMLAPGRLLYVKPGFGIDPDRQDREFSFEFGFRWFF